MVNKRKSAREPARKARSAPATAAASTNMALPPWEQLPDIDLYMDQVIALMTRYLGVADDGKAVTASMVNNYVKTGLVPAPTKKRYGREHLAYLAIVCSLKAVLPLSSIHALFERELEGQTIEQFYEQFRAAAEETVAASRTAYDASPAPALHAALRARAERNLAVAHYSAYHKNA